MMNKITSQQPKLARPRIHHGHGFALFRVNVPTNNVTINPAKPPTTNTTTWYLLQGPPYWKNVHDTIAAKTTRLAISARMYELEIGMVLDAA
jgi:hypothetical protein